MSGYAMDFVPECITIQQWRRMQDKLDHPVTYKPQHNAPIGSLGVDTSPPMGIKTGMRSNVMLGQAARPEWWKREAGFSKERS